LASQAGPEAAWKQWLGDRKCLQVQLSPGVWEEGEELFFLTSAERLAVHEGLFLALFILL
jgi:hypothetical protein